jgi:catechol 2,3-dioxygenase-like lactoylglutathione lyase family enzyme
MSDDKSCQFTDTMIRVESLDTAAKFLTGVLGMVEIEREEDGIIIEDSDSKQRITLVTTEFGSKYALAVATDDMQAMLGKLRESGAEVQSPKKAGSGIEYALCKGPSGIPIMVYVTD